MSSEERTTASGRTAAGRPGVTLEQGAALSTKPVVLFRRAARVPRVWGPYDALAYNVMSMNPAVMLVVPFLAALAFYGSGRLAIAFVIAGLLCGGEAVVYAFLASSMPRSGGDYYYQSRLLSGPVGSVVGFACIVLGGTLWMAIACWLAANLAVGPAFIVIGRLVNSSTLAAVGESVQSGTGMLVLSLGVIAWASLANIRSPRSYLRLQLVLWAIGGAAVALPIAMLLLSAPGSVGDGEPFLSAIHSAASSGFVVGSGGDALALTVALVPVAAFTLIYPAWSIHHIGELREAVTLRTQLLAMLGAEMLIVALSACAVWAVTSRFGGVALEAGAYLFITDREALPFPTLPIFWFFDGRLWPTGVAALCLVVFFNALFWMWVPDIPLAASRVMTAMATGRSLPRWLGRLSDENGTPVNAIVAFAAMSVGPVAAYAYTDMWRLSMAETLLNGLAFAVTCALAAALPYFRREMYRRSTAAPYELLRVPVITLCGGAFAALVAYTAWRFAVDDGLTLGLSRLLAWLVVGGLYLFSAVVLLVYSAYRRRHEPPEVEGVYRIIARGQRPPG